LAVLGFGLALPAAAFAGQVKGKLLGLEKLLNPVWQEAKDVGSHRSVCHCQIWTAGHNRRIKLKGNITGLIRL